RCDPSGRRNSAVRRCDPAVPVPPRTEILDGFALLLPIFQVARRDGATVSLLRIALREHDQPIGLRKGQAGEQDSVDEAKDGAIGADAKSDYENNNNAECWTATKRAEGVAQVLKDSSHDPLLLGPA